MGKRVSTHLILLLAVGTFSSCLKGKSAKSVTPKRAVTPQSSPPTYSTTVYPTNTPIYYYTPPPTSTALPFPTVSNSPVPSPTIGVTATPYPTSTVAPTPTGTFMSSIDPLGVFAWHIENTGQATFSENAGIPGEDINMNQTIAADLGGAGITIAISDTGVEENHEDLVQNILTAHSRNYTSDNPSSWRSSSTPSGSNAHPHGTHVAGIAAARGSNGLGSFGVAKYASIVPFQYLSTNQKAIKKIDQASGPFDIFNFSYGLSTCTFYEKNQAFLEQLKYGVTYGRSGKGSVYVKSAGNEYAGLLSDCFDEIAAEDDTYYLGNSNLEEDHAYPYYILVAALNARGVSSSYSSPGANVWISAPGGEYGDVNPAIVTTDFMGCDKGRSKSDATKNPFESGNSLNENCNYTSTMNGTSSSAPIISGAIALLLETNPSLTWRDVKFILAVTARKIHSTSTDSDHPGGMDLAGHVYQHGWKTNAAGFNFHNWYGFGALNLDAALSMARNYNSTLGTFKSMVNANNLWSYERTNLNQNIPDENPLGAESKITIAENRFVEAVQIKLSIDHYFISDLGIELTSPSGTKSILMNINSRIIQHDLDNHVLLSNAFYGENAKGQWTLKVIDGAREDTGILKGWGLNIFGHDISPSALANDAEDPSLRRPAFDLETQHEETRFSSIDEQYFIIDSRNEQQFGIKGKCIHNGSQIKITGEINAHTICENNSWHFMLDFRHATSTKHTINIAEVVPESEKVLQTRPQVFYKNPFRSIALGQSHSCALVYNEVYCWGANQLGQLGLGQLNNSFHPKKIIHHGTKAEFKQIDANFSATCGVLTSGAVRCWGANPQGHLGSSEEKKHLFPFEFWINEEPVQMIKLGQMHSCVLQQGAVKCFGQHKFIGLEEKRSNPHLPRTLIEKSYQATDMALGSSHSCALTNMGALCWGDNRGGQFARNKKYIYHPVQVDGWDQFTKISDIKINGASTCAIVSGGVQCLGISGTTPYKPVYLKAWPQGSGVVKLSLSSSHICAATNTKIECYSKNNAFQGLEKNSKTYRYSGRILEMGAGYSHHCALTTRQMFCFGRGDFGQLGNGLKEASNWEGVYPQLIE
jgi:subtilisin-like proprotein convertase family protein/subtilisin family serine protease/alpha-tubulin suppressor-like RCC1 family protein